MAENAGITAMPDKDPVIMREIDGSIYTVILHFKKDSRETAQDKIRRMIRSDIINEMRYRH